MYTRRGWLQAALAGGATMVFANRVAGDTMGKPEIRVYKKHFSRCCDAWLAHLKKNGFIVRQVAVSDLDAVKRDYEIPKGVLACHTAVVSGYIVEGHVPADLIHRILAERPLVAGIAVAGEPFGAPGNERGGEDEPYSVVLFNRNGETKPFAQR